MAAQPQRDRLPFEPAQKRKKKPKQAPTSATPEKNTSTATPSNPNRKSEASLSAIPEAVSQRMIRRMALFAGVPTTFGIASFFAAYLIVSNEWFDLPTPAVAFVSMGWFGLGVLGLSYGVISASWDEERAGTWVGWQEFTTNFGRLVSAWRSARQQTKGE